MKNKKDDILIFNGSSSKLAYLIVVLFSLIVIAGLICAVLFVYNEIALPIAITTLIGQYPFSMRYIFKSFLNYKNERLKIKKLEMRINRPNTNTNKPNTNTNKPNNNTNKPNTETNKPKEV